MKVREEINKYSLPEEREMLIWLFDRNHMQSEWQQVAYCVFVRYGDQSYQTHRCWRPQPKGRTLYYSSLIMEALRFYAEPMNWAEVDSGICVLPAPAHDYGSKAREILDIVNAPPPPNPVSDWVYDKELKRYIQKTNETHD